MGKSRTKTRVRWSFWADVILCCLLLAACGSASAQGGSASPQAGSEQNAKTLAQRAAQETRSGNYPAAIADFRKALAIDPHLDQQLPGLQLDLGLAYFKSGHFRDAARAFRSALRQTPGDQRLTILTGMAYYGAGSYAHAVPYLKQAAQHDPRNLPLRLALAHSCLWSKQYQCVMTTYRQILALNANSAEADMLAGEAMDGMGNTPGAIRQFRAAISADPTEPNVHFGLGYLLWTLQRYPEAEREFRAELKNNPQQSKARAYLGDTLVRENKDALAEPELQKAATEDPSFALPYLDLGAIYAAKGQNRAAIQAFQKVIALDPKDADSHWRLARIYQSMGEHDKARAEFAKVKAMKQEQDKSKKPNVLLIP